MEAKLGFDEIDRQLDIPTALVEQGQVADAEQPRRAHIGHETVLAAVRAEADEAHGMLGAVRAMGAEPDDAIEDGLGLVETWTTR